MPEFQLSVGSDMKNLAVIAGFVTKVAEKLGLDEDETFALQMAIDEACSNVMEHAYCGRSDGKVWLQVQAEDDQVVVVIRDQGEPFDPKSVPRPDISAPLHKRQNGGLGLYLMEKLMDSVEWEFDPERGNTLTMRKCRGKPVV
jgi:serine/threonine-protein kinase RsbW